MHYAFLLDKSSALLYNYSQIEKSVSSCLIHSNDAWHTSNHRIQKYYGGNMMKRKTVKKVIALSSVAATVLTLSGCASEKDQITEAMDGQNYEEALQIYNSWEMDDEERSEFVEAMRTELSEAVENYASDSITYDNATSIVKTVHEMYLSELSMEEASAYAEIQSLKTSKDMFKAGEDAMANNDYLTAMRSFEQVISLDCNYDTAKQNASDAQDAYVDAVLTEAQGHVDKKSYDAALELLNQAATEVPGVDKITDKITELEVDRVLADAESAAKTGDYENALVMLNEFSANADADAKQGISDAYDRYAKEYEDMILGKVSQLRDNKSYIQAIQMLENASAVVPSPEFTAMLETINNEKPMYLCEIKCQNQDKYELHSTGEPITDTLGNSYPVGNLHVISSTNGGWSEDQKGYADYYLGYKYNKLTGVIAPADSSDNINCTISIMGDDVALLTLDINRLTEPYPFEIDVSAVNYLKITSGDVDADGTFTTILYDFTLLK